MVVGVSVLALLPVFALAWAVALLAQLILTIGEETVDALSRKTPNL